MNSGPGRSATVLGDGCPGAEVRSAPRANRVNSGLKVTGRAGGRKRFSGTTHNFWADPPVHLGKSRPLRTPGGMFSRPRAAVRSAPFYGGVSRAVHACRYGKGAGAAGW